MKSSTAGFGKRATAAVPIATSQQPVGTTQQVPAVRKPKIAITDPKILNISATIVTRFVRMLGARRSGLRSKILRHVQMMEVQGKSSAPHGKMLISTDTLRALLLSFGKTGSDWLWPWLHYAVFRAAALGAAVVRKPAAATNTDPPTAKEGRIGLAEVIFAVFGAVLPSSSSSDTPPVQQPYNPIAALRSCFYSLPPIRSGGSSTSTITDLITNSGALRSYEAISVLGRLLQYASQGPAVKAPTNDSTAQYPPLAGVKVAGTVIQLLMTASGTSTIACTAAVDGVRVQNRPTAPQERKLESRDIAIALASGRCEGIYMALLSSDLSRSSSYPLQLNANSSSSSPTSALLAYLAQSIRGQMTKAFAPSAATAPGQLLAPAPTMAVANATIALNLASLASMYTPTHARTLTNSPSSSTAVAITPASWIAAQWQQSGLGAIPYFPKPIEASFNFTEANGGQPASASSASADSLQELSNTLLQQHLCSMVALWQDAFRQAAFGGGTSSGGTTSAASQKLPISRYVVANTIYHLVAISNRAYTAMRSIVKSASPSSTEDHESLSDALNKGIVTVVSTISREALRQVLCELGASSCTTKLFVEDVQPVTLPQSEVADAFGSIGLDSRLGAMVSTMWEPDALVSSNPHASDAARSFSQWFILSLIGLEDFADAIGVGLEPSCGPVGHSVPSHLRRNFYVAARSLFAPAIPSLLSAQGGDLSNSDRCQLVSTQLLPYLKLNMAYGATSAASPSNPTTLLVANGPSGAILTASSRVGASAFSDAPVPAAIPVMPILSAIQLLCTKAGLTHQLQHSLSLVQVAVERINAAPGPASSSGIFSQKRPNPMMPLSEAYWLRWCVPLIPVIDAWSVAVDTKLKSHTDEAPSASSSLQSSNTPMTQFAPDSDEEIVATKLISILPPAALSAAHCHFSFFAQFILSHALLLCDDAEILITSAATSTAAALANASSSAKRFFGMGLPSMEILRHIAVTFNRFLYVAVSHIYLPPSIPLSSLILVSSTVTHGSGGAARRLPPDAALVELVGRFLRGKEGVTKDATLAAVALTHTTVRQVKANATLSFPFHNTSSCDAWDGPCRRDAHGLRPALRSCVKLLMDRAGRNQTFIPESLRGVGDHIDVDGSEGGAMSFLQSLLMTRAERERSLLTASGSRLWWIDGKVKCKKEFEHLVTVATEASNVPSKPGNSGHATTQTVSRKALHLVSEIPYSVPFPYRASQLRLSIVEDRKQHRKVVQNFHSHTSAPSAPSSASSYKLGLRIRRANIYADAFAQLMAIVTNGGNASGSLADGLLRAQWHITFVDTVTNSEEAGIDHGGVFKEFIELALRQCLDPAYGLFVSVASNSTGSGGGDVTDTAAAASSSAKNETKAAKDTYPNPHALHFLAMIADDGHGRVGAATQSQFNEAEMILHFRFVGLLVAKAIYEGIVVNAPFAPFFLQSVLGRGCSIDDLRAVDPQQHKSLMLLKEMENVSDACLYFNVDDEVLGQTITVDLVPGGRDLIVTNDNVIRYMHTLAHYRLVKSIKVQTEAFVQGLSDVLSLRWLQVFNAIELLQLIKGSATRLDIADLKQNVKLVGGFGSHDRTLLLLWEVLEELGAEDQGRFLQFCTGSSRPPLLGFGSMSPPFSIRRAADEGSAAPSSGGSFFNVFVDIDRLPSASTCFNLLKLPPYMSKANLKDKLLQAIRSGAGFDLS